MKINYDARRLVRGALVAALYTVLTLLLKPISFGEVQFRVAEALTLLPILMPEAVTGLCVGCVLANWLGGGAVWDVVFGSLATLIAAILTRRLRTKPLLAAAMPVIFNGVIVGSVVYYCYIGVSNPGALAVCCLSVAGGEAAVVYTLGLALVRALGRTKLFQPPLNA